MKTTKVVAQVCFSGDYPSSDPAGAAVALARQGYEVVMMPERYRPMLAIPGDDFLEASKRVPGDYAKALDDADKVQREVQTIVDPFNGDCYEVGPEADDYVARFCGLTERAKTELLPA